MGKEKTTEEVNRGIAEFMGGDYQSICLGDDYNDPDYKIMKAVGYHESLDALVPVWEKLRSIKGNNRSIHGNFDMTKNSSMFIIMPIDTPLQTYIAPTIQEAAARATLKAIEALNQGEEK